jgi:hypothetical protein
VSVVNEKILQTNGQKHPTKTSRWTHGAKGTSDEFVEGGVFDVGDPEVKEKKK